MQEDFTARISTKTTRRLFFDGDDSLFHAVADFGVPSKQEVLPEAPRIDPFAQIDERNRELDEIRRLAAERSVPDEILVTGPSALPTKITETKNPILIQAARSKVTIRRRAS